MKRAIQEFGQRLEEAGRDAVGLFYYAGHGVQINGTNYMIPLNANIARAPDVEMRGGQARLGAGADGARPQPDEHPDPGRLPQQPAARRSFRSSEQGLSRIDAPRGTLIAVRDRAGKRLVRRRRAEQPLHRGVGRDHRGARARGRDRLPQGPGEGHGGDRRPSGAVGILVADRRVPVQAGSPDRPRATGRARDRGPADSAADAPPAPSSSARPAEPHPWSPGQAELLFWESIEDSDNPELYQEYLRRFPDGVFARDRDRRASTR